jgi:hypothetical protein
VPYYFDRFIRNFTGRFTLGTCVAFTYDRTGTFFACPATFTAFGKAPAVRAARAAIPAEPSVAIAKPTLAADFVACFAVALLLMYLRCDFGTWRFAICAPRYSVRSFPPTALLTRCAILFRFCMLYVGYMLAIIFGVIFIYILLLAFHLFGSNR